MKHRWAALGLVLALSALMTSTASAQVRPTQQGQRSPGPLGQNFPNPFNPKTEITFSIAADSKVTVNLYNTIGQEVAQLEVVGRGVVLPEAARHSRQPLAVTPAARR